MTKWKYRVETQPTLTGGKQEEWLNDAGAEGWELVAAVSTGNSIVKYFKRPVEEEQQSIMWP